MSQASFAFLVPLPRYKTSLNLTGRVFNKLTVESFSHHSKYGAVWNVKCKCGHRIKALARKLVEGRKTACSKACIYDDLTGQSIGTYRVIKRAERQNERWGNFWHCECIKCGIKIIFPSRSIKCGQACKNCCQKLPNNQAAFNQLLWHYKKGASSRGLVFALSPEEADRLFKLPCAYCGQAPSQVSKASQSSMYVYNGIDRIDNDKGYIQGNVAPCCKMCNWCKGKHSLEDFRNWIDRVHRCLNAPVIPVAEGSN